MQESQRKQILQPLNRSAEKEKVWKPKLPLLPEGLKG